MGYLGLDPGVTQLIPTISLGYAAPTQPTTITRLHRKCRSARWPIRTGICPQAPWAWRDAPDTLQWHPRDAVGRDVPSVDVKRRFVACTTADFPPFVAVVRLAASEMYPPTSPAPFFWARFQLGSRYPSAKHHSDGTLPFPPCHACAWSVAIDNRGRSARQIKNQGYAFEHSIS